MRCERVQAELPRLRTGTLSRARCAELYRHLAGCAGCRAALELESVLARELAGLRVDAPPAIDTRSRVLAALPQGLPARPLRPVAALPALAAVLACLAVLAAFGVTGGPAVMVPALDGPLTRAAVILVREAGVLLLRVMALGLTALRSLSIPLVSGATIAALAGAMLVILRDLAAAPRLVSGREEG